MPPVNADDLRTQFDAIQAVTDALLPLPSATRKRVLGYVLGFLGEEMPHASGALIASALETRTPPSGDGFAGAADGAAPVNDIRSLTAQKKPRTDTEMAAVVAYYLAELAPAEDRKDVISSEDLTKYFKQAPYPLPGALKMTLPNAKAAGYVDLVERGRYRLNPVGYNLVAHTLPAGGDESGSPRRRTVAPRKTAARKSTAAAPRKQTAAKKTAPRVPRKAPAAKKVSARAKKQ